MKKLIFLTLTFTTLIGLRSFAGPADLEYFKQFLYQKESIGNDPDFPEYQYRSVMTTWNDMVPMRDGRFLNPYVNLFMYEDGTFLMTYKENYFQTPDSQQFMPGPCQRITGKWSVPDTKLILEGVGTLERATVMEKNGVRLTYDRDLNSAGLAGHSVDGSLGYSNTDMIMCF